MTTQMIVRLDPELKAQLQKLARSEGKSGSQVVRELVAGYVADRDLHGAIALLWDRIGERLTAVGADPEDISAAIDSVRAAHR